MCDHCRIARPGVAVFDSRQNRWLRDCCDRPVNIVNINWNYKG